MSHYAVDYFLTLGRSKDGILHSQSSMFDDEQDNDDDMWNESIDEPWQILFNLKYEAIPINRYPEMVSRTFNTFVWWKYLN